MNEQTKNLQYKYTLLFKRRFLPSQLLKGITREDHIGFTTREMASAWVNAVKYNKYKLGYEILSYNIIENKF